VLVITDGERTAADQALAILHLIKANGEKYVRHLYHRHEQLIEDIISAYNSENTDSDRLAAMTETIQSQINRGVYVSPHLRNNAVDIRSRGMTGSDRQALRDAVRLVPGAELVNETTSRAGPHFHLQFS
jgi:hypothetical protein